MTAVPKIFLFSTLDLKFSRLHNSPMPARRTVLSQTERSFWREAYLAAINSLVARHDGRRSRAQPLADDAAAHADAAVEELRKRSNHWSRQ